MVLLVDGQQLLAAPLNVEEILTKFASLREKTESLRNKVLTTQGPEKMLYVLQRECAVASPDDKCIDILGSEDATTCHILVLRHSASGVTCLSHLDGAGMLRGIQTMVQTVLLHSRGGPEGRLELHLVGGFIDDRNESYGISKKIFEIFHRMTEEVHLLTACVCEFNDHMKNGIHMPIIFGIAVNLKTGELYPATFPDKGPDMALRGARHFNGNGRNNILDIYDSAKRLLVIHAFEFDPWEEASLWLMQSDKFILSNMSTSPKQEPADFVDHIRQTLTFIVENPILSKSVFPSNMSRSYTKSENGSWTTLE